MKNVLERCWKLVEKNAFKYFRDDKQNTYWSVITFRYTCVFLENWSNCYIYCEKVRIIFQEFYWKISCLYCFWAIKDINLFCNIWKCNNTECKPLPIFMNKDNSNYTLLIPPFHNCFQSRMVYILLKDKHKYLSTVFVNLLASNLVKHLPVAA